MPLQIRRGPTADRLAVTPLVGEIVYDTTTGAVYVGNGATAGGVPVTSFSVADAKNATATLFLGTSYTDNTQHSGITFQYIGGRIQATVAQDLSNYQGLITADQGFSGNLWADDSGLIVNSATHTVYGNFVAQGNVLPETTNTINIGSSLLRFNNAYVKKLYLDSIESTGAAFDLPAGTTVGGNIIGFDEDGTYGITISGNVIAQDSTVMVNTGNGSFHGDLIGSVFADDSTILVDGRKGVLRGSLIGNADTATLATTATVATTATLTATNSSINTHYLAFVAAVSGNEGLRTDNGLSYVPSTNTLAAGIFQGNFTGTLTGTHVGNLTATDSTVLINATTKQIGYTGANLTGDFTGNVFTNLIDSADSSAITVTPATIFSSDATFENELLSGNIFPTTSETFSLGSYTKKFDKLYLREQANALWIGNAVIGGSGSIINLPLGSTVGGSPITTTAGTNAVTVTVNTTGTNADYYLGFVDQQSGNRQFFTDDTLKYNPSSGTLTLPVVVASLTGNVTGNVTGNLSATDATIMINASSKEIGYTGATLKGTLTGNVTGDVTSAGTSTFIRSTFSTTLYDAASDHVTFQQAHNTNDARNIGFRRARGTLSVPIALNSGDKIADLVFFGYSGTSYLESVRLSVDSDLPSNGKATFKILNNQGGSMVENFSVDGDGFVNINARLQVAGLSLRENNISSINSNDDIVLDPNGSGTVDFMVPSQTTVGSSGAASPLPAAPTKYIKIKLDGVEYVIPAYLAS
jgi:hypothetical protein